MNATDRLMNRGQSTRQPGRRQRPFQSGREKEAEAGKASLASVGRSVVLDSIAICDTLQSHDPSDAREARKEAAAETQITLSLLPAVLTGA